MMAERTIMKAILTWSIALALVMTFGSALAVDTGEVPLKSARIETPASKGTLPLVTRTILGMTVGKSSLGDAVRKFGEAKFRLDDVEGHPKTLCYRSLNTGDATVLVLEAGPMGGFQVITSIYVAPASYLSFSADKCSRTRSVSKGSASNAYLRLGGQLKSLLKLVKAKSGKVAAGLTEMPLAATRKSVDRERKPVELDVLSGVVAREHNGKIVWFSVYYAETT
jgi:hypothetical protein